MQEVPKFLFVPVSSTKGIGEYMRSKIVADEVLSRWPNAHIEFVLNEQAPYAKNCPYITHLVNDTPTKKIKEVNELVSQLRPDVVIFDAAGRKAQLKHASSCGAKVVFISQHRRKRARGMKIERALVTDSHWVVQPEFVIGDINRFDKFKLGLMKRDFPIFTGSVFSKPDLGHQQQLLSELGLIAGEYLLYSAGSGGHFLKSGLATDLFVEAAQVLYRQTGLSSVVVLGPNYPNPSPNLEGVIVIPEMDSFVFINLLAGAKAAVLSGGDTLLQAIALQVPTVAVAVSKDQSNRIDKCLRRQLILSSDASPLALQQNIHDLVQQPVQNKLKARMAQSDTGNGLNICMSEISRLLGESS